MFSDIRLRESDVSGSLLYSKGITMKIEGIPTCQLVEELKKREGVETIIEEPYEDIMVIANGPAIILKVID